MSLSVFSFREGETSEKVCSFIRERPEANICLTLSCRPHSLPIRPSNLFSDDSNIMRGILRLANDRFVKCHSSISVSHDPGAGWFKSL